MYLGIQLPTHLSNLYSKNYQPFIKTITEDLKQWNKAHFSLFGRAAIIKMNILPRILYLLQTMPICVLTTFLKSLKKYVEIFYGTKDVPESVMPN